MSYEPVEDGQLAAVVTWLEMVEAPRTTTAPSSLRLIHLPHVPLDAYRRLFRRVGSKWLWFSRLLLDDSQLAAIVHHPDIEVYRVTSEDGSEAGMLELDFRQPGECELAFVALVPELAGQGHGRWLLSEALRLAWRQGVGRVHLHTCTLDHPAALSAYRRAGFRPYKRAIERFIDPRIAAILPPDCAPQVPLLGTVVSASPPTS